MRKLLNTLYVTTPESYISKDGENIVISIKGNELFRIPVHNIEGIITFGYMGISPGAMQLCSLRNVGVSFLTPSGKFISRISGEIKGNVLLRRTQYRWADDPERCLQLSQLFIAGKIANSRSILERYKRDYIKSDINTPIHKVSDELKRKKHYCFHTRNTDELRGIEGESAMYYFSVFENLILHQKDDFKFEGRNRRPPKDKVNALLSFCYTLLAHDVQSALETVGLDPYVGFLHVDRPGRASLALDLMEELRAYLCDRFVLSLINRKQITGKGFIEHAENGVIMNADVRKIVLTAWQKRKQETVTHPYLKEEVPIGLLPYVQAMLLARYMRNDLDNYPVFLIV